MKRYLLRHSTPLGVFFCLVTSLVGATTVTLEEKCDRITIPSIEFINTPVQDAIAFLQARSVELDVNQPDPNGKGINIVVLGADKLAPNGISLQLQNVRLSEALRYLAELSGARITVDPNALKIQPRDDGKPVAPDGFGRDKETEEAIQLKLKTIMIPSIEFVETPLEDALAFLRSRARELDPASDSTQRGINLVLIDQESKSKNTPITLKLKNIPLGDALRYTTELAGMEASVEGSTFTLRKSD